MSRARTRLSADLRREQILQAATELFIECGFGNVKMGDIAERLGTSRPNIYTYFPSTEAILDVVLNHYAEAGIAALRADFEANPATDATEVLPVLLKQRELVLLLYCSGTPLLRAYREKVLAAMTEYVKDILAPQIAPEQLQDFEELMVLQHNLYLSAAYTLLTRPQLYDAAAISRHVQGMLEGGYARVLPQVHEGWKASAKQ